MTAPKPLDLDAIGLDRDEALSCGLRDKLIVDTIPALLAEVRELRERATQAERERDIAKNLRDQAVRWEHEQQQIKWDAIRERNQLRARGEKLAEALRQIRDFKSQWGGSDTGAYAAVKHGREVSTAALAAWKDATESKPAERKCGKRHDCGCGEPNHVDCGIPSCATCYPPAPPETGKGEA